MQPAQPRTDAISLSVPTGPPSPEFFIFAAQMCEKQGDLPQARQNLQRALSMWPGNADVLRAAARMEDRQSNLPLAENLYQQAVTANPQNAAALNDLGLCLAREGKLEPSLQVLEQAIHLQPDKSLYRNNAATVLVEMRQDQRALAHLAAVHNPAEANFNLGQLARRSRPPGRCSDVFPNRTAVEPRHATGDRRAGETWRAQSNPPNFAQQTPVVLRCRNNSSRRPDRTSVPQQPTYSNWTAALVSGDRPHSGPSALRATSRRNTCRPLRANRAARCSANVARYRVIADSEAGRLAR